MVSQERWGLPIEGFLKRETTVVTTRIPIVLPSSIPIFVKMFSVCITPVQSRHLIL